MNTNHVINKYRWAVPKPDSPADEAVELIAPDGTLCGVTLRTTINAWGQYNDLRRRKIGERILRLLNNE